MTERLQTYALWGTGDITPENARALLEEYIPDNVGTVFWPGRAPRGSGLRTALDWFESPDFLGDGGAVPTTDIIASLVTERDGEFRDEVYVLALWPEVPGHEDFDFIEAVQREGITVLDLSRAMDHLDLSLYNRPEPTKEEKAAARAEAREEKKRATAKTKLSDAAPAQEELPFAGEDLPVDTGVSPEPVGPVPSGLAVLLQDQYRLWQAVEEAKAALDKAMTAYMQTVTVAMIPVREAIEAQEDAPFDGPYVGVDTKEYYWRRSANTFRIAEGKPKRGESVINLTDDEAREKGLI